MLKKLALLLVLAAAAAFLSPYYTATRLAAALEEEDTQAVASYVDFPAVQAYMQRDLAARGGAQAGGLGAALGNIAGAAMGAAVTPETMVAILKDKPRREAMGLSSSLRQMMHRGHWYAADQFVVTNAEGRPTTLFTRRGLGWTVTGLRL